MTDHKLLRVGGELQLDSLLGTILVIYAPTLVHLGVQGEALHEQ